MKRVGKFGDTFAFEINKAVNAFDFTEKHAVGFAESYGADKIFIFKCIHISPSFLRNS